jgi:4-amino-4-deoxy-L-arabinose transferase-like glycosyltransferase
VPERRRRARWPPALVLVLLAGALLRLAVVAWFGDRPPHIWDEKDYHRLATSLLERGEFSLTPGVPTSERPPLYPAALAAAYGVFGLGHFRAVRLLQAGVSLLNVLLVHRLGALAFGPPVAIRAAALYAVYPSLLVFNGLLLTETLCAVLLTAACCAFALALRRGSLALLPVAGVLFGLAALTRSVLAPVPALLAGLLLRCGDGPRGRRALAAALLVSAFGVTVAPWAVRSSRLEGTFVLVDSWSGRTFMIGNNAFTPLYRPWEATAGPPAEHWLQQLVAQHPWAARATGGELDRLALRHGVRFVLEHPGLTLKRSLVKLVRFWGLEREVIAGAARGYFGPVPRPGLLLATLAIFGGWVATALAATFGALVTPPADRRMHALFLLIIGAVCAAHTLTFGHSRYHLPLMPLVLLYAANAWTDAARIWARRGSRAFAVAAGVSVALIGGWGWEILVADWDRYWTLGEEP